MIKKVTVIQKLRVAFCPPQEIKITFI